MPTALRSVEEVEPGAYTAHIDDEVYLLAVRDFDIVNRQETTVQIRAIRKPSRPRVVVRKSEIILRRQVSFATGSDEILPNSEPPASRSRGRDAPQSGHRSRRDSRAHRQSRWPSDQHEALAAARRIRGALVGAARSCRRATHGKGLRTDASQSRRTSPRTIARGIGACSSRSCGASTKHAEADEGRASARPRAHRLGFDTRHALQPPLLGADAAGSSQARGLPWSSVSQFSSSPPMGVSLHDCVEVPRLWRIDGRKRLRCRPGPASAFRPTDGLRTQTSWRSRRPSGRCR